MTQYTKITVEIQREHEQTKELYSVIIGDSGLDGHCFIHNAIAPLMLMIGYEQSTINDALTSED